MELTGRLAGNAEVKTTRSGRELVAFTVVDNNFYKTKAGEKRNDATFFSCAYWLSTNIAAHLKKGMIVTLSGRVGINSYKKRDGDYMANLTFHANNIKIIARPGMKDAAVAETTAIPAGTTESKDDLPF